MKTYFSIVCIFATLLILIPTVALLVFPRGSKQNGASSGGTFILGESSSTTASTTASTTDTTEATGYYSFTMVDATTGKVSTLSAEDYVVGAVCAELPAQFEVEAIKAQAVIAYTYALRFKGLQESSPDDTLHGADFSNDPTKYPAYYTPQQVKDYYGSNYDEYYTKVSSAVKEVLGEVITYDGELIVPLYHSISAGTTEDAKELWGYSIPYLTSVESPYDVSASDYSVTTTLTPSELRSKFTATYPNTTFSSDCTSWVSIQSTTEVGSVLSLAVGSECVSGTEFKDALGLRSNNFQITYNGDTFTVTTKGYGHGVGLSQYGANQLALQGYTYAQILEYYYTGAVVQSVNSLP